MARFDREDSALTLFHPCSSPGVRSLGQMPCPTVLSLLHSLQRLCLGVIHPRAGHPPVCESLDRWGGHAAVWGGCGCDLDVWAGLPMCACVRPRVVHGRARSGEKAWKVVGQDWLSCMARFQLRVLKHSSWPCEFCYKRCICLNERIAHIWQFVGLIYIFKYLHICTNCHLYSCPEFCKY